MKTKLFPQASSLLIGLAVPTLAEFGVRLRACALPYLKYNAADITLHFIPPGRLEETSYLYRIPPKLRTSQIFSVGEIMPAERTAAPSRLVLLR